MIKETMTVHGALAELKMLDKRIESKIDGAKFAFTNKTTNTKVGGKDLKKVVEDMNSAYDSIVDLICRRAAIRKALSASNAMTRVVIAGKEYSVAEAIEMKRSGVAVLGDLLSAMTLQRSVAQDDAKRVNDKLGDKADAQVASIYGTKEKVTTAEAMSMREAYISANTMDVVTIDKLDEKIEKLDMEISEFYRNVDVALSVSNATTTIEIEY